jgi:preprotein translocase subunit SecG
MTTVQIIVGSILLLAAVFLVIAVLMQSGKSHNLSGTIAGGAETFFGKSKAKRWDAVLNKVTTIVAVCFALLVIVVYVIQPNTATDPDDVFDDLAGLDQGDVTTVAPVEGTTAAEVEETTAEAVEDATEAEVEDETVEE